MYSVGEPLKPVSVRGVDDRHIVQDHRDRTRYAMDLEKEDKRPARTSKIMRQETPGLLVKKVNNRGYDDRNLVPETRKKIQHNKANSVFNLTPPIDHFQSV